MVKEIAGRIAKLHALEMTQQTGRLWVAVIDTADMRPGAARMGADGFMAIEWSDGDWDCRRPNDGVELA